METDILKYRILSPIYFYLERKNTKEETILKVYYFIYIFYEHSISVQKWT